MTKKKSEMTPEQYAHTKSVGLAWRERNRAVINERQQAKRAAIRAERQAAMPPISAEDAERLAAEKRAAVAARKKQWRTENADRIKAQKRANYLENRESLIQKAVDWGRANPERRRQIKQRHEASNPEMRRAIKAKRRARERNAEGTFTAQDLKDIVSRQGGLCATCRCCLSGGYEADHIQPLALGGSNWPENIQALCRTCNRSKGAKRPEEFERLIQAEARYVT